MVAFPACIFSVSLLIILDIHTQLQLRSKAPSLLCVEWLLGVFHSHDDYVVESLLENDCFSK